MPPNNWTDSAVIKDQKRTEEGMIDIFKRCCGKLVYYHVWQTLQMSICIKC